MCCSLHSFGDSGDPIAHGALRSERSTPLPTYPFQVHVCNVVHVSFFGLQMFAIAHATGDGASSESESEGTDSSTSDSDSWLHAWVCPLAGAPSAFLFSPRKMKPWHQPCLHLVLEGQTWQALLLGWSLQPLLLQCWMQPRTWNQVSQRMVAVWGGLQPKLSAEVLRTQATPSKGCTLHAYHGGFTFFAQKQHEKLSWGIPVEKASEMPEGQISFHACMCVCVG